MMVEPSVCFRFCYFFFCSFLISILSVTVSAHPQQLLGEERINSRGGLRGQQRSVLEAGSCLSFESFEQTLSFQFEGTPPSNETMETLEQIFVEKYNYVGCGFSSIENITTTLASTITTVTPPIFTLDFVFYGIRCNDCGSRDGNNTTITNTTSLTGVTTNSGNRYRNLLENQVSRPRGLSDTSNCDGDHEPIPFTSFVIVTFESTAASSGKSGKKDTENNNNNLASSFFSSLDEYFVQAYVEAQEDHNDDEGCHNQIQSVQAFEFDPLVYHINVEWICPEPRVAGCALFGMSPQLRNAVRAGLNQQTTEVRAVSIQVAANTFTTQPPTSLAPVTAAPVTAAPVTAAPVTAAPITGAPITAAPITGAPVTAAPVTSSPITAAPVTASPVTAAPITSSPVTAAPVTASPITAAPVTASPVTAAPVTSAPITAAPVTAAPITASPVTAAPITAAPVLRPTPVPSVFEPERSCSCAFDEEEFEGLFVEAAEAEIDSGSLSGVISVLDNLLKPVDCGEQGILTGNVFLSFEIGDSVAPDEGIPPTELVTLEGTFSDTYNDLSLTLCDNLFRRITTTTLSLRAVRRRLVGTDDYDSRKLERLTTSYKADVNGTCRRCSSDTTLFEVPGRGRRQLQMQIHPDLRRRRRRANRRLTEGCFCDSASDASNGRAPFPGEFGGVFNENIDELVESGNLTSVVGAENLEEVDEVVCSPEISTFQSTVFVGVEADNAFGTTIDEISALEESFTTTYNVLSEDFCDEFFRSVASTKFEVNGFRRLENRQFSSRRNHRGLAQVVADYRASVNATCRLCAVDSTLFSTSFSIKDPSIGQTPPSSNRFLRSTGRRLQADDECYCPLDTTPGLPSADQFRSAYDESVLALNLPSVDGIAKIEEVRRVQCSSDISTFGAELYLSYFVTEPEAVTDDETTVLGDTITTTYNDLQRSGCDEQFRSIVDSRLQLQSFRRLGEGRTINHFSPRDRRLRTVVEASYKADVNGTCRRCSSDTALFRKPDRTGTEGRRLQEDKKGRSRRHRSAGRGSDRRSLQSFGDVCFCRADSLSITDAPDAGEFFNEYNDNVESLELPNVAGVGSAAEVPPIQSCTFELISVFTSVQVDFVGSVDQLDIESISNQAKGFYNAQRQDTCDLELIEITLSEQRRRKLQGGVSSTDLDARFDCIGTPGSCVFDSFTLVLAVEDAVDDTGVEVEEVTIPSLGALSDTITPAPSNVRFLEMEEENFFADFEMTDSACKCVDCDDSSGCEDLWQGRTVSSAFDFNPPIDPTPTHVVVSHCDKDLTWLRPFLANVRLAKTTIFSRCGKRVFGAPSDAVTHSDQTLTSNIDAFLGWIVNNYDQISQGESVIFLEDKYKSHFSGSELVSAAARTGFGCGNKPLPTVSTSMSVFYSVDILQRGEGINTFWTENEIRFEHRIVQVCDSGSFATSIDRIRLFGKTFWARLRASKRSEQFMPKTWAGLLSTLSIGQVESVTEYSNKILGDGRLVHTYFEDSTDEPEVVVHDDSVTAKLRNYWNVLTHHLIEGATGSNS